MPELPEVEVTRQSFADRIAGAVIGELRLGKPLRWPLGVDQQTLRGRQVQSVAQRYFGDEQLTVGTLLPQAPQPGAARAAPRAFRAD